MNRTISGRGAVGGRHSGAVGLCASTAINARWVNPQAGNRLPVKSVMVMGINRDSTARRIYEDAMVAQLNARGVKAVQSYKFLPEDGPAEQQVIQAAVAKVGADAVLISRTVSVTNEVQVSPGYVAGPPWGFGWPRFLWLLPRLLVRRVCVSAERLHGAKGAGRYAAVRCEGILVALVGLVDDRTNRLDAADDSGLCQDHQRDARERQGDLSF